jgi:hypothetical protein
VQVHAALGPHAVGAAPFPQRRVALRCHPHDLAGAPALLLCLLERQDEAAGGAGAQPPRPAATGASAKGPDGGAGGVQEPDTRNGDQQQPQPSGGTSPDPSGAGALGGSAAEAVPAPGPGPSPQQQTKEQQQQEQQASETQQDPDQQQVAEHQEQEQAAQPTAAGAAATQGPSCAGAEDLAGCPEEPPRPRQELLLFLGPVPEHLAACRWATCARNASPCAAVCGRSAARQGRTMGKKDTSLHLSLTSCSRVSIPRTFFCLHGEPGPVRLEHPEQQLECGVLSSGPSLHALEQASRCALPR